MAYHFLIDGYNVLYAMPEMPAGTWQEKREKLLAFLVQTKPQGKNDLTVVFDSREGPGSVEKASGLTVIFTSGETADDRISNLVRHTPNPRTLIVVSNDRGIQTMVKGTGARFLTADEFLKQARTQNPTQRQQPSSHAEEITEELKKKWL